jgi:hypothetical protein
MNIDQISFNFIGFDSKTEFVILDLTDCLQIVSLCQKIGKIPKQRGERSEQQSKKKKLILEDDKILRSASPDTVEQAIKKHIAHDYQSLGMYPCI